MGALGHVTQAGWLEVPTNASFRQVSFDGRRLCGVTAGSLDAFCKVVEGKDDPWRWIAGDVVSVNVHGDQVWTVDQYNWARNRNLSDTAPWRRVDRGWALAFIIDGKSYCVVGLDTHSLCLPMQYIESLPPRNEVLSVDALTLDLHAGVVFAITPNGSTKYLPANASYPNSAGPYQSISSDGTFVCASKTKTDAVYCVEKSQETWHPIGGRLRQLVVREGRLYGVARNGSLWTTTLKASTSNDDGEVKRLEAEENAVEVYISSMTATFPQINDTAAAVASDGQFMCVSKPATYEVLCTASGQAKWRSIGGNLTQLAIADGQLYGVARDGSLWETRLSLVNEEEASAFETGPLPVQIPLRQIDFGDQISRGAFGDIFRGMSSKQQVCGVTAASGGLICAPTADASRVLQWTLLYKKDVIAVAVNGSEVWALDETYLMATTDQYGNSTDWDRVNVHFTDVVTDGVVLVGIGLEAEAYRGATTSSIRGFLMDVGNPQVRSVDVANMTSVFVLGNMTAMFIPSNAFPASDGPYRSITSDGAIACATKDTTETVFCATKNMSAWLPIGGKLNQLSLRNGRLYGVATNGTVWTTTLMVTDSPDPSYEELDEQEKVADATRIPLKELIVGKKISRGAFGDVYKGSYDNQVVAIKVLAESKRRNMSELTKFAKEARFMAALEHNHIVRFVGVAWNSPSNLCIVSEFLAGGDVRGLLQRYLSDGRPEGFSPKKIKIALHVAHALTYLHSLQPIVLHRDLKSKNILLTEDGDAKLTDFGVSREFEDVTMTAGVGTSLWMAPEIIQGERYDEKADVYSFGVVLSELDTNDLPFAEAQRDGVVVITANGRGSREKKQLHEVAILQLELRAKLAIYFGEVRGEPSPGQLGLHPGRN
ncbi:hypothetical protein ATCC90586_010305 [Pythium insidiosum]|nr:hypothetical protein ATCC90586_010305 [Pythium insidiosum]